MWQTAIKGIHLGYFEIEAEAAKAYDKKAVEVYGKEVFVNFKE